MRRRLVLRAGLGLAFTAVGVRRIALAQGAGEGRVVEVTAQRFRFTPNEIAAKRGETLVLAITSLDFVHGFSVPELQLRADLPPGRVTRVTLTPTRSGRIDFLCDNFCGDGHEGMHGVVVVT
jgi:cytochrome c oxidase subunit 2